MRLLILDNDLGFLFWLANGLGPHGYYIVPADSVAHANRLIRRLKLTIDLLIVNPEVEGAAELIASLRRENPRLQVVALVPEGTPQSELSGIEANAMRAKPDLSAVVDPEHSPVSEEKQAEWLRFVKQILGRTNTAGGSRAN